MSYKYKIASFTRVGTGGGSRLAQRATIGLVLLLIAGAGASAFAQASLCAEISIPGSVSTTARGINNAGTIVGRYADSDYAYHGFVLAGGQVTTIDVPGAVWTEAQGINENGDVVGAYGAQPECFCVDDIEVGAFIYSAGTISTFSVGLSQTWALGINSTGAIVGYYHHRDGDIQDHPRGFLRNGSSLTLIDAPGGGPLSEIGTEVRGINDAGVAVGRFFDSGYVGFQWTNGVMTVVADTPPGSSVGGINSSGAIVGSYYDEQLQETAAFVKSNTIHTISCLGATYTQGNGISNTGIVGNYLDENWNSHGFMSPFAPLAMRLTVNAFLPFDHIPDPHPIIGVDRVLEGDGDERTWDEDGSSRVSQIMYLVNQDLSPGPVFLAGPVDWANITQQYETSTSVVANKITAEARNDWELDAPLKTDWGVPANQAEGCSGHVITMNPVPTVGIRCEMQAPNGVYPAWLDPAIAYDFSMTFGFTPSPLVNYSISGCRKYFPAYEVWAAGEQIYAGENSSNPFDIVIPCSMAVQIEKTGTVTLQ